MGGGGGRWGEVGGCGDCAVVLLFSGGGGTNFCEKASFGITRVSFIERNGRERAGRECWWRPTERERKRICVVVLSFFHSETVHRQHSSMNSARMTRLLLGDEVRFVS